jgi:hypothetical protein
MSARPLNTRETPRTALGNNEDQGMREALDADEHCFTFLKRDEYVKEGARRVHEQMVRLRRKLGATEKIKSVSAYSNDVGQVRFYCHLGTRCKEGHVVGEC